MGIKGALKKVFGEKRLSEIKGQVSHYACSAKLKLRSAPKLSFDETLVEAPLRIEGKSHFFRGYYDLEYFSADGKKFLCHRLDAAAVDNKDKCAIGYYDLEQQTFIELAQTNAWCWQQGSRLRWDPANSARILYNDADDSGYCARIFDVERRETVKTVPAALYDVTPDMKYGYSLNYARLQRLRPGYGYDYHPDKTAAQNAPEDDGLFLVDIETGEKELLFSLANLAQKVDPDLRYQHYLNHISVARDGKRMIFFHIFTVPGTKDWKVCLYACNTDGSDLTLLEVEDRASHYCWINDHEMMVTFHREDGSEYYAVTDVFTGAKEKVEIEQLDIDGHPNVYRTEDAFVTDTYPLVDGLQMLLFFDRRQKTTKTIARIYHDFRMRGQKRCDLHPSISGNKAYISVDTTYRGGLRSILIFKTK